MDVNRVLSVFLLILVVAGVSDTASGVKLRVLMAEGKGDENPNSQKVSRPPDTVSPPVDVPSEPSQNPPPELLQSPPYGDKSSLKTPNVPPVLGIPPPKLVPPSGPEVKATPVPKSGDHGENDEGPKGSERPPGLSNPTDRIQKEGCDAPAVKRCHDGNLVACLQHPENEPKELVLLVQNAGENVLSVNITMPTSVKIDDLKMLNLSKHSNKKVLIKFSADAKNSLKIVLNAGKEECVLEIGPSVSEIGPSVSGWNPFQQFPAYATWMTPRMYGAYFLFFTIVIAGGAWACCKFGRRGRRAGAGVPYQQLEMGAQPQSNSAVVETSTADGWDQGWDDDWDEEEAAPVARPSDKHPTGNVSSNGLATRSTNKQRWDDDWDD